MSKMKYIDVVIPSNHLRWMYETVKDNVEYNAALVICIEGDKAEITPCAVPVSISFSGVVYDEDTKNKPVVKKKVRTKRVSKRRRR